MERLKGMRWYNGELWKWTVGALLAVLAASLLSGCKTTKYVPMEKVVYRESVRHDTLHTADSVWVHDSVSVILKGDTVYKDRLRREKVLQRVYRTKTDTVVRRDSIPAPYPVEKELTAWERFELKYAVWSMGALCVMLVWILYKLYKRIRNGKFFVDNNKK